MAGASIAAPVLADGRRGHPVGFGARWRDALCALEGDVGARHLLSRHPDQVSLIPTRDDGCAIDVDRIEDVPIRSR
jgi:molybdenum cofactor cytidylyltransferase